MALSYFYAGQMRNIITHFIRIFSDFKIRTGPDANGNYSYTTVPVIYGDPSRQAAAVITQNSTNVQMTAPMMSCYITSMDIARDRAGGQYNTDNLRVSERVYDEVNGTYGSTIGNSYTVNRLQPNPLDLGMTVDILTTNTEQKCQLFEQIYLIFNPVFEMQITSNALHYTPKKRVELVDMIWDIQGTPAGTQDDPSILRLVFKIEMDLAPPAQVKKQTVIQNVIQDLGLGINIDCMQFWSTNHAEYIITTPQDAALTVTNGNSLTLLGAFKNLKDANGNIYSWAQLIDQYGELIVGDTRIRLRWTGDINDDSRDIIGFINYTGTDNVLSYEIDANTLPSTTLADVNGFINPHIGTPIATTGQRYILTDDVGDNVVWGNLTANKNDIVQFNGMNWQVVYSAASSTTIDIVKDLSTGSLFMIVNLQWEDIINRSYAAGYWRIVLQA